MGRMLYYFKNLTTLLVAPLKLSLWQSILIAFGCVISPYYALFIILMSFVLIDMLTGIVASYKNRILCEFTLKNIPLKFGPAVKLFCKNIQSRKLRYTVEKLVVYMLVMLLISFFEHYFFSFEVLGYTFTKVIVGLLAIIEIRSIFENFDVILNKKYFSVLFNLFKKAADDKIKGTGEVIDNITNVT
jgi:hypothetical protein